MSLAALFLFLGIFCRKFLAQVAIKAAETLIIALQFLLLLRKCLKDIEKQSYEN